MLDCLSLTGLLFTFRGIVFINCCVQYIKILPLTPSLKSILNMVYDNSTIIPQLGTRLGFGQGFIKFSNPPRKVARCHLRLQSNFRRPERPARPAVRGSAAHSSRSVYFQSCPPIIFALPGRCLPGASEFFNNNFYGSFSGLSPGYHPEL